MKNVYIFCNGGFGNRYYSLLTGLYICEMAQLKPTIIWPVNNWCGAEFNDIFDSTLDAKSDIDYSRIPSTAGTLCVLHDNFFGPNVNWININIVPISQIVFGIKSHINDVFIGTSTLAEFVDLSILAKKILPKIPFKSELHNRVQQVLDQYVNEDQLYYGLHLRKTDAIQFKYTDEQRLHNAVKNNPNQLFFVCSDDQPTEQDFLNRYTNVFCHSKSHYVEKLISGEWNSTITDSDGNSFPYNVNRPKDSVQLAIVDLLLLSRSLLEHNGSNPSSFLRVAELLKKLNIAKKTNT